MKFKTILINCFFTIACLTGVLAQESQTKYYFFDDDWNITNSDDYAYYRKVGVYADGGYANPIVDYYRSGQVQCIIQADYFRLNSGSTFLKSGAKNGDIAYYNEYGKLTKYERYENGQLVESRAPKSLGEDIFTPENIQAGLDIAIMAWQLYDLVKRN
jgi:antitoxin component YwqK of YwqJK toxin-antitoxin module